MSKSVNGICKLCQKQKTLCNSHIIPEFFYKQIYDTPQKYQIIHILQNEKSENWTEQKGYREYMLCKECEGLFSKYERYAGDVIYFKNGKANLKIEMRTLTKNSDETLNISGIDYKGFKLFGLSVLWRILESKIWGSTSYSKQKESIRLALLNENPLKENQFGFAITYFQQINSNMVVEKAGGFITNPYYTLNENTVDLLHIFIDGYRFSFNLLIDHTESVIPVSCFLNENGTINIGIKYITNDEYLLNFIKRIVEHTKK